MEASLMATDTAEQIQNTRMTLVSDNYISEYEGDDGTGRHPAGRVLIVDEKTAQRWRNKGIAIDAAETDKTLLEEKKARMAALQAEIDAIGTEANTASSITRAGGVEASRERTVARGPARA